MKDVYQILIENFTNERLDKIAYQDNDFALLDKRLDKLINRYDTLSIPRKQARIIDKVIDAYAAQSARYASLAYKLICSFFFLCNTYLCGEKSYNIPSA